MSDLPSEPPKPFKNFPNYEPKGIRFTEGGREWLLVQEPGYHFDGWLCRRHPDGQWVSMRKATDEDRAKLAAPSVSSSATTPQDFEKLADSRREAQAAGERIEAIRRKAGLPPSAEPAPPIRHLAPYWIGDMWVCHYCSRSHAADVLCCEGSDEITHDEQGPLSMKHPRVDQPSRHVEKGIALEVDHELTEPLVPADEATWRAHHAAILRDPDQFCAGAVYLSMALHIQELETSLSGSISERETLTAELEKFRDWFQNAEQARAVAESNVERLTREKAQLATQLEAAKQFREAPH